MNYHDIRWNAMSEIFKVIATVGDLRIAKVLESNIFTLPVRNMLLLSRLLKLTQRVGDDLEECLNFCREAGILDGPVAMRQALIDGTKIRLYSITIPYNGYLCISLRDSVVYISDDVNGRFQRDGMKVNMASDSRLGFKVVFNAIAYELLLQSQVPNVCIVHDTWVRAGVYDTWAKLLGSKYTSIYEFPQSKLSNGFDLTDGTPVATLECGTNDERAQKMSTLCYYCDDEATLFYLEDSRTGESNVVACYRFVDPTTEELHLMAHSIAFIRGVTRIEFADQSNINRHINKLLL